jgi:hypothetical protein
VRLYRPALIAIVLCHLPAGVHASELTDVIDALDGDDPYDFTAEIKYTRQLKRAKITREYNCRPLAGDASNPDRETCVDTFNRLSGTVTDPDSRRHGDIVHVKELRYERVTHWLTPTFRFGIWHDLELRIDARATRSAARAALPPVRGTASTRWTSCRCRSTCRSGPGSAT